MCIAVLSAVAHCHYSYVWGTGRPRAWIMELMACPGCDLLQRVPALSAGERAVCTRCAHALAKQTTNSLERCLALTVAAGILLLLANLTPLMTLVAVGRSSSTTILGGAFEMWREGQHITSVIVAFCAVIAPAGFVLGMLALLLAARRTPTPHWTAEVLRWTGYLQVWSLHEVMMLGILVALVKIAELADVNAGVGIFCIGALALLFPAIMFQFDGREVWDRIAWARGQQSRNASNEVGRP